MVRTCFLFLLIFCAQISFAQDSPAAKSLQVPVGNKLLAHVYAKGVQVYVCKQDAVDSSIYTWTLKGPLANLYTDSTYKRATGKHYFTDGKYPTWEGTDGSKVIGAKLLQANSPDGAGIPWLLLKASVTSGTGVLTPVTFIQRVNTKGGKAPLVANKQQQGQLVKIPYTAEYLFYGKN
jgi:hypothetical protein